MTTKSRLDKAINGLQEIVTRHKKQDKFQISKDKIIINSNKPELWGTVFYLALLILLPAGIIIYYLFVDKSDPIIFWLLLFDVVFIYNLYKLIRGSTILTIDINKKYFQVENINALFKKFFPAKKVPFSDIVNSDLLEKSISSKYSSTRWLQLVVEDKEKNKIVLTDLSEKYPESFIARKVKFFVDVIIWTEKQI